MELHVVAPVEVSGDAHLLLLERLGSIGIGVEEGLGFGYSHAVEEGQVPRRRSPVSVWRLLLAHENEGPLIAGGRFEPFDGKVGHDVGHIPGALDQRTVHPDEMRVIIVALAGEDFPVIESPGRRLQVPFADQCGDITGILEELRKSHLATVEAGCVIVHEPVQVGELAGQNRGSRRSADRISAEGVLKESAFPRDAIDIGRRGDRGEASSIG